MAQENEYVHNISEKSKGVISSFGGVVTGAYSKVKHLVVEEPESDMMDNTQMQGTD